MLSVNASKSGYRPQHTVVILLALNLLVAGVITARPQGELPAARSSPREAYASGPPLTPLVTATLTHLTSFQARMTATSQGAEAATFGRTVSAVRRGGQWQFDIVDGTRPRGAGDTTVVEYVISGTTVCSRVSFNVPRGTFSCMRAPHTAADLAGNALPILNALPPGASQSNTYTYTRGGTARLHGQLCDAYRYVVHTRTALETSALYLSHATGRPCEQDATTVGPPLFGLGPASGPTGTATTTSLTVWSRFNDPTLTIPWAPLLGLAHRAPAAL